MSSFDKSKERHMENLTATCNLKSTDSDKLLAKRRRRLNRKTIFFSSLILFGASLMVSCEKDDCYVDEYGDYVCDEYRKPSDTTAPGIK